MKNCIWIYGLSGSGKSTLSVQLKQLIQPILLNDIQILDADEMRKTLCKDLGFSLEDRHENISRIANYAKQLVNEGKFVIVNAITPKEQFRKEICEILGNDVMIVALDTPIAVCAERDPKGLYKLAKQEKISDFTGISSDYDDAATFDVKINNSDMTVEDAAKIIMRGLQQF